MDGRHSVRKCRAQDPAYASTRPSPRLLYRVRRDAEHESTTRHIAFHTLPYVRDCFGLFARPLTRISR